MLIPSCPHCESNYVTSVGASEWVCERTLQGVVAPGSHGNPGPIPVYRGCGRTFVMSAGEVAQQGAERQRRRAQSERSASAIRSAEAQREQRRAEALERVDRELPSLAVPARPIRPQLIDPDPFWALGLIPWWAGSTVIAYVALFSSHRRGLITAAEVCAAVCIAALAIWLMRAYVLRARFAAATRSYDELDRAAAQREKERADLLESLSIPSWLR